MKQVGCNEVDKSMNEMEEFDYTVEQFADLQLLRYKVYGFAAPPLICNLISPATSLAIFFCNFYISI